MATTEIVEVRTKAAAEKALKAGKPIRITGGKFALAIASLSGVNIEIKAAAKIELSLTNVSATVSQEDMSSSRVEAWGSSRVVAWESSRVVAWESSSVEARGYSMLQVHGAKTKIAATDGVAVNLWNGAVATGGRQFIVEQKTPQDWCDHYGVCVEDGLAIVYKAVGKDYVSSWGTTYAPGTMPKDHQWDGCKRECSAGGGLNFSPTPRHTHLFVTNPDHYLECRVRLDEMVVHFDGRYPEKVCAPEVAAPLIEVDVNGDPIVNVKAA